MLKWFQTYILPPNQVKYKITHSLPVYHPDIEEYSYDFFITKYIVKDGNLIPQNDQHYSLWFPWDTTVRFDTSSWHNLPEQKKYVYSVDEVPFSSIKNDSLNETDLFNKKINYL